MKFSWKSRLQKEKGKRWINNGKEARQLLKGEPLPLGWSFGREKGTRWITNGKESKRVAKDAQLPEGWEFGRKISQCPNSSGKSDAIQSIL